MVHLGHLDYSDLSDCLMGQVENSLEMSLPVVMVKT